MPIKKVNGAELYYEEYGSGDKIVLSAQMGFNKGCYQEKLADEGFHVYTITLRGYGKSTHVHEDLGDMWFDTWADDVVEFSKSLGVEQFIYTGNSHGGGVGWHIAVRYPERLKAFISIVGGPHDLSTGTVSEGRKKMLATGGDPKKLLEMSKQSLDPDTDDPQRVARREKAREQIRQRYLSFTPEEVQINFRKPFAGLGSEEKLRERLRNIQVPVLMLGGLKDPVVSPETLLRSAVCVPNSKTVFYQDFGHSLSTEITEEVIHEIVTFLNSVEKSGKVYITE